MGPHKVKTYGPAFLSAVFDKAQLDAVVLFFLRLHNQGFILAQIFWGLWLFPMAFLVIRSRFLPRFIGYWLIVNGMAYVITSFTGLLLPQFEATVSNVTFPALLGELVLVLWLLIKGANVQRLAVA